MEVALKAMAHEGRRAMLALASERELSVGEMAEHFPDISGPAVSQHLKVLLDAELVSVRRDGKFRYYRTNADRLEEVRAALEDFWGPAIDRLNERLAGDS